MALPLAVIILHFICLAITRYLKPANYLNDIFHIFKRKISLYYTSDPSLMISKHHYTSLDKEDMIKGCEYAKALCITFGGLYLIYRYSQDFIMDKNADEKSSYFGLYSADGEKFWSYFWTPTSLYDNPLKARKYLGTFINDIISHKKYNKNLFESYSEQYNPSLKIPYLVELNDTTYTAKNGHQQNVNQIKWWVEETHFTLPLLHWIHLDKLYVKKYISLAFESDTELGVERGSWKGGVIGSSIKITKKDEPKIYHTYKMVEYGNDNLTYELHRRLIHRINFFMKKEQRF